MFLWFSAIATLQPRDLRLEGASTIHIYNISVVLVGENYITRERQDVGLTQSTEATNCFIFFCPMVVFVLTLASANFKPVPGTTKKDSIGTTDILTNGLKIPTSNVVCFHCAPALSKQSHNFTDM